MIEQLIDIIRRASPYIAEMQRNNIHDPDWGLQYDNDLGKLAKDIMDMDVGYLLESGLLTQAGEEKIRPSAMEPYQFAEGELTQLLWDFRSLNIGPETSYPIFKEGFRLAMTRTAPLVATIEAKIKELEERLEAHKIAKATEDE